MPDDSQKTDRYKSPAKAVITGITDLFKKSKDELDLQDLTSLEGKKVLITGASSGLGFATSIEMAKRGAHVIMAVRSGMPQKGEDVKRFSGSDRVDMIPLDLANLDSLEAFSRTLSEKFGAMDIIVCNAAMVANKSRAVKQGLDEMFVVNYFAKFLLVKQFLDGKILNHKGPDLPRIIFVASESHRNASNLEWDSFGSYAPYGIKQSVAMYGYYKLLLLTMVQELSRRLNREDRIQCSVFSLCPGPVNSNIAREAPLLFQPLLKLVFGIFFRSPKKACRPIIYLAASREQEGKTGTYLFLLQEKNVDDKASDPENGARLWELSEQLEKQIFK